MAEIVYILTNPRIPGLVKVGVTRDLEESIHCLSAQEGVPVPYDCFFACEVEDGKGEEIKDRLLNGFRDRRINPVKGFLEVDPDQIKVILEGYGSDIGRLPQFSPIIKGKTNIEHIKSVRISSSSFNTSSKSNGTELIFTWKGEKHIRRINGNFASRVARTRISVHDLGLDNGTTIYYERDHNITAKIDGPKTCRIIIEGGPLIVNGEFRRFTLNRAVNVAEIILDGYYKNRAHWMRVYCVKDERGNFISIEDYAKTRGFVF